MTIPVHFVTFIIFSGLYDRIRKDIMTVSASHTKPYSKTAIVAPIGTSPPVITAGIDAIGEHISDLVLLATQDEQVLAGCDLVRLGLQLRYPHVRIHEAYLPFDDITNDDENLKFMAIAARVIKESVTSIIVTESCSMLPGQEEHVHYPCPSRADPECG
jgi:CRISPR-associated Csx14 family protein